MEKGGGGTHNPQSRTEAFPVCALMISKPVSSDAWGDFVSTRYFVSIIIHHNDASGCPQRHGGDGEHSCACTCE
jgi:hypothetical protein